MAIYTHLETATTPAAPWTEVDVTITSISGDGTTVVLTNTDGTRTVLSGTGLVGTTGAAGSLTSGTITAMARTNPAGTITFEQITGISYAATSFSLRLPEANLQGVAADNFSGNDTFNGYSGRDFFRGSPGDDTLNGGGGLDSIRFSGPFHSGAVTIVLSATSTITGNATVGTDTLNSVELIIGSNSADSFTATAQFDGSFGDANFFEGRGGNDTITGNGHTRVNYSEALAGVTVNMTLGTAQSTAALDAAAIGVDSFTGVNGVVGSDFADIITGDANVNFLDGAGGGDTLNGAGGFDFARYVSSSAGLTVNLADPSLNTGDAVGDTYISIEALQGSNFADHLTGNASLNFLRGDDGADVLDGGGGDDFADHLGATAAVTADLLTPANNTGEAAGDTYISIENLRGTAFDDTLRGNDAVNFLRGDLGADALDGRGGRDVADYQNSDAGITVNLANPSLNTGEAAGDTYTSIEGIRGSDFNDNLTGDAGANRLFGDLGDDTMTGGLGNDTYFVDSAGDQIIETDPQALGIDTVRSTISYSLVGTALDNIILLETGNAATNNLTATGNAVGNQLRGNSGDNTLDGLGGSDAMAGATGNDTYFVDNPNDYIEELVNEGIDTVNASASHKLWANVENLLLTGSANISAIGNDLANELTGNTGANFLNGGLGADRMAGGAGNDTYLVDSSTDVIVEDANPAVGGIDTVRTTVDYSIAGTGADNVVLLGTGDISATGNASGNQLIGNAGNNTLDGQSGTDAIVGGAGNDTLTGGVEGGDQFHFRTAAFGQDEITDFGATDGAGHDTIIFATSIFANFAAVQAVLDDTTTPGSVIIQLDASNSITLANVALSSIDPSDFAFLA